MCYDSLKLQSEEVYSTPTHLHEKSPILLEIIGQITTTDTTDFRPEQVSSDRYILFCVQQIAITSSERIHQRFMQ